MLAASSREHIASADRLGSGPALGPQHPFSCVADAANAEWTTEMRAALRRRWQAWWDARHPARDTHQMGQHNIYILPSRPGLFFCATLLVLLLASINDQLSLGYALTFLLAGAGFASMHATHGNLRALSLDLKPPPPGFAGGDLEIEVRLHNSGSARYGIGLAVQHGSAGKDELAWCDVPARGHAIVHLRYPAQRRGLHAVPTLHIETRFPLGLFRAWSIWRPAAQAWVYPRPEEPAPPLPTGSADSSGESSPAALRLPGPDFEGVRPYQRGDTPRQVLWKKAAQSAHAEAPLLVRDTQAPAGRRLWLDIADTAGLDWEARLSRLTAWVLAAEQRGLLYGLRLPGRELPPEQGSAQRQAALELLAAAEPSR